MADYSSDDVSQLFWESSRRVNQLWHTGAGQLPLSVLQGPLEVLKEVLKGGLSLTAEWMHVVHSSLWHSSAQRSQPERDLYIQIAEAETRAHFTWRSRKVLREKIYSTKHSWFVIEVNCISKTKKELNLQLKRKKHVGSFILWQHSLSKLESGSTLSICLLRERFSLPLLHTKRYKVLNSWWVKMR